MLKLYPNSAVYSVLLPEVKQLLNDLVSNYYIHPTDKEVLLSLRNTTIDLFRKWVSDIVDLSDFNHAYPINGATGGIEQWMLDHQGNIAQFPGEYGWLKIQRPWIGDANRPMETAYVSNPFSATGSFHHRHQELALPTLLDCAFVGSTMKQKIELTPNISAITFSFSKGFAVNLFRTGFLFSRHKIPALESWLHYNYHNILSISVARKIIENFPVDYIFNKFRSKQLEICNQYDLTPSDCVFLATSVDAKYNRYKRGDGTNRICLSREYM
jgi:hypothetical protein